ncbi:MAG: DNA (cytosine-5-)-methyltransferase [Bacteroidota bacterium]
MKSENTNTHNLESYSTVDLFCGIGGLTHGLELEGLNVVAGYDIDESCRYAYEANNRASFILKNAKEIQPHEILSLYTDRSKKILVGCAPCQPFSALTNRQDIKDKKWDLLYYFSRLIKEVKPEIISMENVPTLKRFQKGKVFDNFVNKLEENGYYIHHSIVFCPDYGLPQNRSRLVLLASKLGPITLINPTHSQDNYKTVRDVIAHLPPIEDGEQHNHDRLHRSSKLSPLNKTRIQNTPEGGSWKDWDEDLVLECHKKQSGKSYSDVYGRMKWDQPSPTMTTKCTGLGNGRFGHPEQDRAISLREAALFQTFPQYYDFIEPKKGLKPTIISRHIGNAVPVDLGRVIAKSIKEHILIQG